MTLRLARNTHRPASRNVVAADVMTRNPKSIHKSASVRDTAEFLMSNGIHTAPYLDSIRRVIKGIPGAEISVDQEQGGPVFRAHFPNEFQGIPGPARVQIAGRFVG